MPHTLPPALDLDAGLIRLLSTADRRLGELAGVCRAMQRLLRAPPRGILRGAPGGQRAEHLAGVLEFFLRGVAGEAGDAAAKARRLRDLQTEWRGGLTAARASGLAFRLLDRLFAAPILTIPQVQKILGVTYRTAKAQVEKLAGLGILAPANGKRRGKVYLAQSILAALEEPGE